MKYFTTEYAYIGNTKIHVFKENGVEAYYTIQNDYNVEGYCNCLKDMGYVEKHIEQFLEEMESEKK